jgi:predicted nucleic acid-binding protein
MPPTVSISPPEVFIDTGGFLALHVPEDPFHAAAINCRKKTLCFSRLYTSSAVIAETVSHIQHDRLLDQENLNDLINDFLAPGRWGASLLPVDDQLLMKGLKMVQEQQNRRFSLVDATNILLMEKHGLDIIFAYDTFYDGVSVMRGFETRFIQRIGA